MTMSWKVKVENCTVWKSEMARKSSPCPGMTRVKATPKVMGRTRPAKNVFVVDASAASEPRLTLVEHLRAQEKRRWKL